MKRARWGAAKTQIYEREHRVAELLKTGQTYNEVYSTLIDEGLKVTLRTFLQHVPNIKNNLCLNADQRGRYE